tara:strand:- start:19783 stop:20874 length:1092 start_codon:yes stop_codon:yes gene_type:complete
MKFSTKKYTQVVTTTPLSSLSLAERIIYSFLIYHLKNNRGASVEQIADHTKLDRFRCIPKAIAALIKIGLVQKANHRFEALQPSGDKSKWFVSRKSKGTAWYDKLAYFTYYTPVSMPYRKNAVLCLLHSMSSKVEGKLLVNQTSKNGLANMLNLSRNTIHKIFKKLEGEGLIKPIPHMSGCWMKVGLFDIPENLFVDRTQYQSTDDCGSYLGLVEFLKSEKPEVKAEPTPEPDFDNEPEWDDFLAACQEAGIDDDCIRLLDAEKEFYSYTEIMEWIPKAVATHNENQRQGKHLEARHCGYLLLSWLKKEEAPHKKRFAKLNEEPELYQSLYEDFSELPDTREQSERIFKRHQRENSNKTLVTQ